MYNSAYKIYKEFLDSLPKEVHYRKKTIDDYDGYDWIKLRQRAREIIDDDNTPDMHKLILSLYIDMIPRRTSDYLNMRINQPNDVNFNLLVFKKKSSKYFVINLWKNAKDKKRVNKTVNTQTIDIINKHLINVISEFLKKHPKNKYLLEENGEPIQHARLSTIMADIRKKYDLHAFSINSLRHLGFAKLQLKFDETQLKALAFQMGTSVSQLEKSYIDYENSQQYNVDELDKQYFDEVNKTKM